MCFLNGACAGSSGPGGFFGHDLWYEPVLSLMIEYTGSCEWLTPPHRHQYNRNLKAVASASVQVGQKLPVAYKQFFTFSVCYHAGVPAAQPAFEDAEEIQWTEVAFPPHNIMHNVFAMSTKSLIAGTTYYIAPCICLHCDDPSAPDFTGCSLNNNLALHGQLLLFTE